MNHSALISQPNRLNVNTTCWCALFVEEVKCDQTDVVHVVRVNMHIARSVYPGGNGIHVYRTMFSNCIIKPSRL